MNEIIHAFDLEFARQGLLSWIEHYVLVLDNVVQVALIALALIVARVAGPRLGTLMADWAEKRAWNRGVKAFLVRLSALSRPVVLLVFMWIAVGAAVQADMVHHLMRMVASLTSAWVVIRIASGFIRNDALSKLIAWTAWTLAALTTVGVLDETVALLDSIGISFGQVRISLLTVVKGVLALAVLLWAAIGASNVLERRIHRVDSLTPSVQVLLGKLAKIVLITLALLIAINSIGIDLTALTVFSGALGIGIGFGLQKIISNLVSGLILLMDKSIKPGDVIAVGDTFGWIVSLGARYAAVRTRDGIEHLIPNEELIIQRVENWSHTDKAVRLKIPIGISYKSDVRLAIDLCLQAADAVRRVLKTPEPRCLLKGFGDSSVDLEIRIWIDDPPQGRANVISEVLLGVWDRFHEHGIEIPFPQRDLHLKSSALPLVPPLGGPSAANLVAK